MILFGSTYIDPNPIRFWDWVQIEHQTWSKFDPIEALVVGKFFEWK